MNHGTADAYLCKKMSDKEHNDWTVQSPCRMPLPVSGQQDFAVEFYKYMDSEFPASPELQCPQFIFFVNFRIAEMISNLCQTYFDLWDFLRTYATQSAFMSPGPFHFRPFMLPHRHDFGLRGTADWDPCLNQPKCHSNIKHLEWLKTNINKPPWGNCAFAHAAHGSEGLSNLSGPARVWEVVCDTGSKKLAEGTATCCDLCWSWYRPFAAWTGPSLHGEGLEPCHLRPDRDVGHIWMWAAASGQVWLTRNHCVLLHTPGNPCVSLIVIWQVLPADVKASLVYYLRGNGLLNSWSDDNSTLFSTFGRGLTLTSPRTFSTIWVTSVNEDIGELVQTNVSGIPKMCFRCMFLSMFSPKHDWLLLRSDTVVHGNP